MSILAIIPARSGSKGLINKNIKKINGKTLIELAFLIAKKANIFSDIIVSTDSDKYKKILKKKNIFISSLRQKKFAKDNTTDLELLTYEINKFEKKNKKKVKYVCLLQPTSPLRLAKDIIDTYKILIKKKLDSVWTISRISKKFNPIKILKINEKNERLSYFSSKGSSFKNRQSLSEYYIRNGVAYFFSRKTIIDFKNILPKKTGFLIINRTIVNIDDNDDLLLAKKILKKNEEL